jgi:hypothetical protein
MQIELPDARIVDAKVLKIHCKVCDRFDADLIDAEGRQIKEHTGYVPSFMPGKHFGDYVILDIDIETGQVVNWKAPRPEQLAEWINGGD